MKQLQPRQAYFTHICHDLPHAETEATFPPNVHLAYDGLELEVPLVTMRVARSLEEAAAFEPVAVTIGNFDGVHTGHQLLLHEVTSRRRRKRFSSPPS